MGDINTNLTNLQNYAQRVSTAKTAIANAITSMGGTVGANDGLEEFANAINSIPSGGGGSSNDAVRFMDYDGTVVQSYSATDFANLTALPANPSHTGLTSQGWNWTLSDAKTYVAEYKNLDIGQMYVTSDGKTRIYITLTEGRISPILQLYLNANSELDIDWGDGGTHSTFTTTSAGYGSERHEYSSSGDYVIAITVVNGGFALQSSSTVVSSTLWNGNNNANSPDRAYNNSIQKIEIGTGVTTIGNNAFNRCYSLSLITIPDTVTSIDSYAFYNCYSLSSITIPNTVTTIGSYAFQYCYSLSSITIPNTVTTIDSYAFGGCYSLSSITIPNTVTTIGGYAFQYCHSLSSITIPDGVTRIDSYAFSSGYSLSSITIPDTVTSIDSYAFYQCYSLSSITIPDGVTSIGQQAFNGCYSLSSITIPDGVTSIGLSTFYNCYSLSSITIPDGVTSIGQQAFQRCCSLSSITIGNSVTSIGQNAFQNCSFVESIKFAPTTPPTVSGSSTLTSVPTSCTILVPINTYSAYTTKTNYPKPTTYTYLVFGTYESGAALPSSTTDNYNLTWYATITDARAKTNPITVGNGNEVYARCTAI